MEYILVCFNYILVVCLILNIENTMKAKALKIMLFFSLLISCHSDVKRTINNQNLPDKNVYILRDSIILEEMKYKLKIYENKFSSGADSYLLLVKLDSTMKFDNIPTVLYACGSYIELGCGNVDSVSYEFNLNELGQLLTHCFCSMDRLKEIETDINTIIKYYISQLNDVPVKNISIVESQWIRVDSIERMKIQYYSNDFYIKKYRYRDSDEVQIIFSSGSIISDRLTGYPNRPKIILLKHYAKR